MTRRKGKTVKKNKAAAASAETDASSDAPHSFVVHRGQVGNYVQQLVKDFRQVMEPNTASSIKVRRKNVIKDFAHVAGPLKVSHIASFTKTDLSPYLKLARFPRGPTLTFKVKNYTLARDVRSSLKRQITYEKQFLNAALLIMNGFKGEGQEIPLMTSMFQNFFPSINVTTVKVNTIRRCVLLDYDAETGLLEFRHYTIKVVPTGLNKGVKKLVKGKVPNLSRYDDIAEYLENGGAGGGGGASESEAEDDEASKVTLPQAVSSRGNLPAMQSSVRLVELGPRLTMELVKIEEGLHDGEVLYHKHFEKSEEEKKAIRTAREKAKKEKEKRRKDQALNVKKKEEEKAKAKQKSLEGMKAKGKLSNANLPEGFKATADSDEDETEGPGMQDGEQEEEEDDDAEYYRQEVGENPDKDMFDSKPKRFNNFANKRKNNNSKVGGGNFGKRFKKDENSSKKPFDGARNGGKKFGMAGGKKFGDKKFGDKKRFGDKKFGDKSTRKFGGDKKFGDKSPRKFGDKKMPPNKKAKRPTDQFNKAGIGPRFDKSKASKGPKVVAKKGKKFRK